MGDFQLSHSRESVHSHPTYPTVANAISRKPGTAAGLSSVESSGPRRSGARRGQVGACLGEKSPRSPGWHSNKDQG